MNPIRFKSEYLIRYGDLYERDLQFGQNCFAFSQEQQIKGVALTIDEDDGLEIGRAYLTADKGGMRWEREIVDVRMYAEHVEKLHHRVGWRPLVSFESEDVEWIDDVECITSAHVYQISLVPLQLLLPKKELRLMTA